MWYPKRVLFEERALGYERGQKMLDKFKTLDIPVEVMGKSNRVTGISGATSAQTFAAAKEVLVVRVRNTKNFETCKPSAHYQLPLSSSCPGKCEYCYLHTNLGKKPYLRVYVNIEEILARAGEYIKERLPAETLFEGAATSDPLPTEPFTGALADTIKYFGQREHAKFRFVTKFTNVDTLLPLDHNGKTRFRFSVNAQEIINNWEHGTPGLTARLEALEKVSGAGYSLGLIIAPVVLVPEWEKKYQDLFKALSQKLRNTQGITLEIILHRFTPRAKSNILEIFPNSQLPMDTEENRRYKYGQFGYGKYVYTKNLYEEAGTYFKNLAKTYLPQAKIEYIV